MANANVNLARDPENYKGYELTCENIAYTWFVIVKIPGININTGFHGESHSIAIEKAKEWIDDTISKEVVS